MDYVYEAAALSYMPDLITGERLNVAVLMVSRHLESGITRCHFDFQGKYTSRLSQAFGRSYKTKEFSFLRSTIRSTASVTIQEIEKNQPRENEFPMPMSSAYSSFDLVKSAISTGGLSAFHWGETMAGVCVNTEETFAELCEELVTYHYQDDKDSETVSDSDHWKRQLPIIHSAIQETGKADRFLENHPIETDDKPVFLYWEDRSKKKHMMQAISFQCSPDTRDEKTTKFFGLVAKWQSRQYYFDAIPLLMESEDPEVRKTKEYQKHLDELTIASPTKTVIRPEEASAYIEEAARSIA